MGIPHDHPAILQAIERGLIAGEGAPVFTKAKAKARARRKPAELVAPALTVGALGGVWAIPCEVPSLANSRDWRVRNRVTQAHRRAVSRAFGRGPSLAALARVAYWLHAGRRVKVVLTRLGGAALDRHDNLHASLKYVLDAVCLFLGVDDADRRLVVEHGQEPGGAAGVRVELSRLDGDARP